MTNETKQIKPATRRPRRFAREAPDSVGAAEAPATTADAADKPAPAKRHTKADTVLGLLKRDEGAALAELVEATGWLPHTTRAHLTGLRKKGHTIEKSKRDDVTCYRIVVAN